MNNTTSLYKIKNTISLYVIKINDSIKIIESSFDSNIIISLINYIYNTETITIYKLSNKTAFTHNIILSKLKLNNSFLIDTDMGEALNISEFCNNIIKFIYLQQYFIDFKSQEIEEAIESNYDENMGEALYIKHLLYDNVEDFDGSNYYELNNENKNYLYADVNQISELLEKKYYIYYNNVFNNIIILKHPLNQVKNIFPELIEIYSDKLTDTQYNQILDISKDIYVNIDDAKININKIINNKILCTKLSITELKNIINEYFITNDNIDNKIKFSHIWTIMSNHFNIDEKYVNYYKHLLPIVLQECGLNKKRYSDGIYWYGLIEKKKKNNDNEIKNLIDKSLDTILKFRKNEIENL